MKFIKSFLILLLAFFISHEIYSGFVSGTLVKIPDGYEAIENLFPGDMVCSFDLQGNIQISKVKEVVSYVSSRAIRIKIQDDLIATSPSQKYYIPYIDSWQEAENIKSDTKLCSLSCESVEVNDIVELYDDVDFFDIHLEDVHTFCVTKQDIVVHNFIPIFAGISFVFGGGVAFESICGGICLAGVWLGSKIIIKRDNNRNSHEYDVELVASCGDCDSSGNCLSLNDAQAPGKPTEKDGFVPKKNWDGKKVKHPVTGQVGWPDKKGDVWVPTGVGPLAHGGPHWDVISKDGKRHRNIVPGGKQRGAK